MIDFPWEDILTELDREVISRGGYGKSRGLGNWPCLMMIDCQYNHIGADAPILEQIGQWPAGGGEKAWDAVRKIQPLLEVFRKNDLPVVYTRYAYSERGAKYDAFALKRGKDLTRFIDGARGTKIVDELAPQDADLVIDKTVASAFSGTPLLSYLIRMDVDTLLFTGVSTSGCVRASTIDAVTYNFNAAVLWDCVADRIQTSHKISLLDIWMKYADVISSQEAYEYIDGLIREKGELITNS